MSEVFEQWDSKGIMSVWVLGEVKEGEWSRKQTKGQKRGIVSKGITMVEVERVRSEVQRDKEQWFEVGQSYLLFEW